MADTVRVIAAVIEREGRLLICERPSHKRHGGLWEFPGGKVEEGESDLEATTRELGEELEVAVTSVGDVIYSVADPGSHFIIEFLHVGIEGEPRAMEHSRIEWVRELDLLQYALAPSDLKYAQHRMANGRESPPDLSEESHIAELLEQWASVWGVLDLSKLEIRFSNRLSKTLGRTRPSSRRITLASRLREPSNSALFRSVLCHEAAHVAAYELFGPQARPHGPEWAALITKAGEAPSVHLQAHRRGGSSRRRKRWRYVHHCTVCHATRLAYRPVPQWRCTECVQLGLPGTLEITRKPIETEEL